MSYTTLIIIAIGLSMDAFAVSMSKGLLLKEYSLKHSLKFASFFGIFQFLMLYIGYYISKIVQIDTLTSNNLPAFILVIFGVNMIYQTIKNKAKDKEDEMYEEQSFSSKQLIILSLSTSIDAMAVGMSISIVDYNVNMLKLSIFIGFVSFIFSVIGVRIGKAVGSFIKNKAEYFGGAILIIMGVRIIVESF
jgi:manganese efflux pump family protein